MMVRLAASAARRYAYAASLSWGGDIPTGELEVEVSFSVAWGSPESGRHGPPENYDPGSGDVVEDIRVEKIEGQPAADYVVGEYMPGETIRQITDALEMDHEEAMILSALQDEDAAHDDAMEHNAEESREVERIFGHLEDDE